MLCWALFVYLVVSATVHIAGRVPHLDHGQAPQAFLGFLRLMIEVCALFLAVIIPDTLSGKLEPILM